MEKKRRGRGRPRKESATKKCVCEECNHIFTVPKADKDQRFCKKECERKAAQVHHEPTEDVKITNIEKLLEEHEKFGHEHHISEEEDESFITPLMLHMIIAGSVGLFMSMILCYYDVCLKSYAALIGLSVAIALVFALPTLIARGWKWLYKYFMGGL